MNYFILVVVVVVVVLALKVVQYFTVAVSVPCSWFLIVYFIISSFASRLLSPVLTRINGFEYYPKQ